MVITDLTNLWVGYNRTENFRILICASSEEEAQEVADSYLTDSSMSGSFEISEYTNTETHFDCDYVLYPDNE